MLTVELLLLLVVEVLLARSVSLEAVGVVAAILTLSRSWIVRDAGDVASVPFRRFNAGCLFREWASQLSITLEAR